MGSMVRSDSVMRPDDTGLSPAGVPMESEHAGRVREHVACEIAAVGGWITFERYMDLVLYAPGLGYYSAGSHKLGAGGDFTTAPEISGLFGACVARQCAEVLRVSAEPVLLEIGAGTGRLAVDVLSRLETLECLPARYLILEVSADLRERQGRLIAERLPHLAGRVKWLDSLPPQPFDGVILANEVLDALPVARFRWHEAGCEELGVALADGNFVWDARPASPGVQAACRRLAAAGAWDDGYVSEYCPRLVAWSGAIARCLRAGAILWFDYGLPRSQYYLAERHEGTLICHYRQRAHGDPFANPGLEDVSAWVDFTALAEAGSAADCTVAGFTTQAWFLAALGIDEEMRRIAGVDADRFARLARQARQLLLPGEMGEAFKVMAWTRAIEHPLAGFALRDLRHTL